jgi:hypothetical protein
MRRLAADPFSLFRFDRHYCRTRSRHPRVVDSASNAPDPRPGVLHDLPRTRFGRHAEKNRAVASMAPLSPSPVTCARYETFLAMYSLRKFA